MVVLHSTYLDPNIGVNNRIQIDMNAEMLSNREVRIMGSCYALDISVLLRSADRQHYAAIRRHHGP